MNNLMLALFFVAAVYCAFSGAWREFAGTAACWLFMMLLRLEVKLDGTLFWKRRDK